MTHLFFDHLVTRQEITTVLDGHIISVEEKEEIIDLVDQTLTHHILNVILNHLPKEKHSDFISRFKSSPGDRALLDYLKEHAHPEIEEEIRRHAEKIKTEIKNEIKKSRRK